MNDETRGAGILAWVQRMLIDAQKLADDEIPPALRAIRSILREAMPYMTPEYRMGAVLAMLAIGLALKAMEDGEADRETNTTDIVPSE